MDYSHRVVTREEWLRERKQLLAQEKAFTHQRDQLSEQRRALPWVRVEQNYLFEGPEGQRTLSQLFERRSQLVVYHLMFEPDAAAACRGCSFWADGFDSARPHLAARDVSLVAVSRSPLAKLAPFAQRMGWHFPWYSSAGTSFNADYGVLFSAEAIEHKQSFYNYGSEVSTGREKPGISVFVRDAQDRIFHTYSCYGRGIDMVNHTYQYLDLVPKGRDEAGLPFSMAWLRHHDAY